MLNVNTQRKENAVHSLTYEYLLKKYGLTMSWEEAAAELNVYWENIRKLCKKGDIAAEKVGKSWLLTTKALADYIDHGSAKQVLTSPSSAKRGHRTYVSL